MVVSIITWGMCYIIFKTARSKASLAPQNTSLVDDSWKHKCLYENQKRGKETDLPDVRFRGWGAGGYGGVELTAAGESAGG